MAKPTYGTLDESLRSIGFTMNKTKNASPPARVYHHEATGALILLPVFPLEQELERCHLVAVKITLETWGVTDPEEFERRLREMN
jgi:hypothetical protein